jgi:hypothetical protein
MGQAQDAIAYAQQQIGKPYVWATAGPNSFDCSGLMVAAYRAAKPPIQLPHFTGALIAMGKEVARSELQPGDLVFPDSGHVQLYIGNGQMIEAQQKGVPVRQGPLWGFWRGRRVVSDGSSALGGLGGALGALPNPFTAGADLAAVLRPFGVAGLALTAPQFWKRIGMGIMGVSLIAIGIVYINRRPLLNAAGGIADTVGGVVGTAVQGASFGVGAGTTGGLGGGKAVKTVSAPAAASSPVSGPVSATPVTAPLPEFDRPTRPPTVRGIAKSQPRALPMVQAKEVLAKKAAPRKRVPSTIGNVSDVGPLSGRKKGLSK